MKRIFSIILLAGVLLSCIHENPMEERAKKQIVASMDSFLEGYFPGNQGWRMEDLETVYVNDSICILQCSAWIHDAMGKQVVRDYRYIYLLDMDFSRANHKPVFAENFLNVLCLSRKEIAEGRRNTRRSGENIYESARGGCIPILHPFDE